MNESDARRVLLLRAFEAPLSPPWSDADAAWASREAASAVGESADTSALIARRAALALPRLTQAEPRAGTALALTDALPGKRLWLLLAFAAGLSMDALGTQRVVNLFAPPLWGMLLWNLLVYVVLAGHALRGVARQGGSPTHTGPLRQGLGRLLIAAAQRLHGLTDRQSPPAIGRFLGEWWRVSQPLNAARLATLMHLAAAALACGALAGMYARGVFFDFRAGWESTFFDAHQMYGALSAVLGPASWLSGVSLPSLTEFSALRMPGSAGETARPWIHLFAVTTVGVVIVPRLVLAGLSAWQAQQRTRDVPIVLDDDYFKRLARGLRSESVSAQVIAYNYQAAIGLQPALKRVLEQHLGLRVTLRNTTPVPLGAEDSLDAHLPQTPTAAVTVVLFALTATPERETHRAFVTAIAARLGSASDLLVVVDESGFRQRLTSSDASQRLNDRREAWRDALQGLGKPPLFVDLSAPEAAT